MLPFQNQEFLNLVVSMYEQRRDNNNIDVLQMAEHCDTATSEVHVNCLLGRASLQRNNDSAMKRLCFEYVYGCS